MARRLGYLPIRGAAHPIRFLLEYVGEPYEEKIYDYGPPPAYEKTTWLKEKFNLGFDFPGLPYYIEGDLKITQSTAIARYIASKHNLVGRTEAEQLQVDILQRVAYDVLWSNFIPLCFCDKSKYEKAKEEFVSGPLVVHLDNFSKYLGDKKFFVGGNVTYVDFYLYEVLRNFSLFAPDVFNKYSDLKRFLKTVEDLPAISKYMKSDRFIASPTFPTFANWTG